MRSCHTLFISTYQVDVVSKWIDYKAETLSQSSALVNMALNQDVKVDDIF